MEKANNSNTMLKDAEKAFKKGEAAIKTGIFRWSPDYMEACMQFDKASKAFKTAGDKKRAVEAYLKMAECSEKQNENWSAGESLVEAAFLEKDKERSLEYLHRAQNFYKMNDTANRGQQTLKKYAQKLLEQEEDEEAQSFALNIFQSLFDEVFEGDNLAWNPDIITDYLKLLMQKGQYQRAVEAKETYIAYMAKEGTIDHQIRRAFLEIVCIQIVAGKFKQIDATLTQFTEVVGISAPSFDEYKVA